MKHINVLLIVLFISLGWPPGTSLAAWVETENGKHYIVDKDGVKWDVTQAKELGFIPQRFQYGIGKNAFTPLDDSNFSSDKPSRISRTRVIGIANDSSAQAYSVDKLRRHEIANTNLDGQPIAVGY